jgi:hypothetical protein
LLKLALTNHQGLACLELSADQELVYLEPLAAPGLACPAIFLAWADRVVLAVWVDHYLV